MRATRVERHVRAAPAAVYAALIDAAAVARWRVPDGMRAEVHAFDAREGGAFRISLTYQAGDAAGKSSERTDTYRGRFVSLVPGARVVETLEFETERPELRGEMTLTTSLAPRDGGTDVTILHEGVPAGIDPADNETGTRMALDRLAALVEDPGG